MAKYGITIGLGNSDEYEEVFGWLIDNIREDDAMDWEYEVEIDE